MSSEESNSSSAPPANAPDGKPRGSAGMVALSLILLALLVWAMAPDRPKFTPAPLRSAPAGCPLNAPDFVPSDITEIPALDLSSLFQAQRNRALYRLNMEPCPCGCNASIAVCRTSHPACRICEDLAKKIVSDEKADMSPGPQTKGQN